MTLGRLLLLLLTLVVMSPGDARAQFAARPPCPLVRKPPAQGEKPIRRRRNQRFKRMRQLLDVTPGALKRPKGATRDFVNGTVLVGLAYGLREDLGPLAVPIAVSGGINIGAGVMTLSMADDPDYWLWRDGLQGLGAMFTALAIGQLNRTEATSIAGAVRSDSATEAFYRGVGLAYGLYGLVTAAGPLMADFDHPAAIRAEFCEAMEPNAAVARAEDRMRNYIDYANRRHYMNVGVGALSGAALTWAYFDTPALPELQVFRYFALAAGVMTLYRAGQGLMNPPAVGELWQVYWRGRKAPPAPRPSPPPPEEEGFEVQLQLVPGGLAFQGRF